MKSKVKYTIIGRLVSAIFAATSLHAADVTWDTAPGTVGVGDSAITGGAGTWDTTNGNWTTDGGANNVAWDDGNNDIAIFSDTGGTVTLGTDINLSGLEFTSSGYTIDGGGNKLILGNNGGIKSSTNPPASLVGAATINADIDTNGFRLTTVEGTSVLSGVISGSGGFATYNSSNVTLSGANTYTGKTDITSDTTSGSSLTVSSLNSVAVPTPAASSSLGVPADAAAGTILIGRDGKRSSCTLNYTGTGETTDRVVRFEFNSSSSQTINASGSGLLKFTSAMTSNANYVNQSGSLILTGTGDGEIVLGLPLVPPGGLKKQGAGTWTLGGANTYITGTTVSAGTLTINGSLADASMTISGGSTTVDGSGTLTFNVDGTSVDLIDINGGTVDLSGFTLSVSESGDGANQAAYVIIDSVGGGSYSGTFASESIPSGYSVDYDYDGFGTQVALVSTGGGVTYATWSGGAAADADANGDGVENAVAYALGAADVSADATGLLPTSVDDGTYLVFTYNRSDEANDDTTTSIEVEYGSDLNGWTVAVDAVDGVIITETGGSPTDAVEVKIPKSLAVGDKLFARLRVVVTP